MKVRKNCIVWLILATLSSIMAGGCGQKGNNMSQRTQTEKPIQTEQQAGSASPAASGEKTEDQNEKHKKRKTKSVTVIDETGKNRKLRLGDLDEKNVASYFCIADPTGKFSQVDDGHYYYLKSDGKRNYSIFQDEEVLIGKFSLEQGFIHSFVKCGTDYYAIVEIQKSRFDSLATVKCDLVRIDLERQNIEILISDLPEERLFSENSMYWDDIYEYLVIYQGCLFYDSRIEVTTDKIEAEFDDGDQDFYAPGDYLEKINLQNAKQQSKISCTVNMNEAKPYLTFVDGKVLYGKQKGEEVFLYSFDLETQKEKEFFHYKRNKAYKCYGAASYDSVFLSIDDKYIYCQDFAIPRNGGKMQPLLRNAMQYDNGLIAFSSNSKYIYYLDQKYKMHRIDKKTKKDTQICKTEMLSVHCTEEKVYAKKYKDTLLPLYWDDDGDAEAQEVDDPSASILYCMDLDGKNVKRIWEGGW